MAFEARRYKGVARNGKIELEKDAKVPEGAEVIVLFEESGEPKKIRTMQDLLESEFFGMWKDRDDLPKTNEEFREWRRKLWERKSS